MPWTAVLQKPTFVVLSEALVCKPALPKSITEPFKWRHFLPEIILQAVRWYCRYALSYRDIEELMLERGVDVDHTTVYRWVQKFSSEIDQRCRPHLRATNDSWRVDETYLRVKGAWKYLYRAVDSDGNTLDFLLTAKRDASSAKRFFRKVLNASHTQEPRVINVDKNPAYPPAVEQLQADSSLPRRTKLRQVKYLNNIVEQDHRFIKRLTKPGMGFQSFNTARLTLRGFEAMNMIRKGQIQSVDKGDVIGQISFLHEIFGVAS
jgi:transposase, IS6 family